jgi:type II secretory pathway pseudopilin PulG
MNTIIVLGLIGWLVGLALGPIGPSIRDAPASASMQISRMIALAMFAYSNDNGQHYPDGKSSTEVFQKLLDGNYVVDPTIFYLAMPGKVKPPPGTKQLKPENVSWDVTSGVDSNSPNGLPLVFATGWRVNYGPGGAAVPLIKPFPRYGIERVTHTTWQWLTGDDITWTSTPGLAVTYKSNSAWFRQMRDAQGQSTDDVPDFVPKDFQPDSRTYIQLTPTGPLQ